MTNPQIAITVQLTPNPGIESGYDFSYSSTSPQVGADGTIDLSNYGQDDVQLVFTLAPVAGTQPTFAVNTQHPNQIDEAIWFAEWPRPDPPPVPCPSSAGHANSSFRNFDLPQPQVLQFVNKNNDNRRYAYALRCQVPPGNAVIEDDPIIINKVSQL